MLIRLSGPATGATSASNSTSSAGSETSTKDNVRQRHNQTSGSSTPAEDEYTSDQLESVKRYISLKDISIHYT